MADKFLSFTYRGQSLKTEYNGYIENDGSNLQIFNAPNFSNEFAFPKFGETSHFLGVNKENREFNFTIIFVERTLSQYREILNWLNLESKGKFSFDYSPNYSYDVKLSNISPGTMFVSPNCDPNTGQQNLLYNVEVQVGFTTIGDWAAKWSLTDPVFSSSNAPLFESFETHNIPSGAYTSGTFNGTKVTELTEVEWSYQRCNSEETFLIDNKGVMLAFAGSNPSILDSNLIPRGIKSFSIQVRKAFTNDKDRNLTIKIFSGGSLVFTSTNDLLFGTGLDNSILTIEEQLENPIEGDFSFEFSIGGTYTYPEDTRQIVIDNLRWTSFEGVVFSDLVDNDDQESFVREFDINTGALILYNAHNLENFYNIDFEGGITITVSGETVYKISENFNGTIFTKYGIALDSQGNFLPLEINKGIFSLQPNDEVGIIIEDYEFFAIRTTSREYV
jgi:hypothetical protein